MDFNTWIGVFAGSAVTFIFYRLSLRKKLDFFLILDDQPLSNVNEQVRERLVVGFLPPTPPSESPESKTPIEVGSLQHLQFIVKNGGLRGIKFEVPPWFELPQGTQLLDASVVYKLPADLEAALAIQPSVPGSPQKITISTPLLNRSEYILVKLLLAPAVDANALILHAVAEDLHARQFAVQQLPPEATKGLIESFSGSAIFAGLLFLFFGTCCVYISKVVLGDHLFPKLSFEHPLDFIAKLSWVNVAAPVSLMAGLILALLGAALAFDLGFQKFAFWKRVYIPPHLRPWSGK